MGELYKITGPTGKAYIGITMRTADIRFKEHIYESCRKRRARCALYDAMKKYGHDNFTLEILRSSDNKDELCELEQQSIVKYMTLAPLGYNLTVGGEGVQGLSEEAAAYRKSQQKKTLDTPEHRKKLSDAAFKISDQISERLKDRWSDPIWKAATTEKIRIAMQKRKKEKPPKKTREQLNSEHSARMKKLHAEHPEKFLKSRPPKIQSEESNASRREKMKDMWQNPEYRDRIMAKKSVTMRSEEYRLHQSIAAKAAWEKRKCQA